MVAAFKQAGQRVFTGFDGIPLLSLPGKLHVGGNLGFVGKEVVFILVVLLDQLLTL